MLRIWHSCTKPVSLSVDRLSGKIYPFLYCFNTIVWMSRSKVVYTLLFYNFLETNKFSFNVHPLVSTVRLSMVLAMQVPRERTHAPCRASSQSTGYDSELICLFSLSPQANEILHPYYLTLTGLLCQISPTSSKFRADSLHVKCYWDRHSTGTGV